MEIRWRVSCENKNVILKVWQGRNDYQSVKEILETLRFNSKSKQSSQPAKKRKKERKAQNSSLERERENI